MNRIKKLSILFAVIGVLGVSACETLDGAGRDIEKAGESIQDAAN